MSQEQMAPGCEHARCVCWLTQIKNILVTLVLFPLYTALMFSAEKQKQNYYIHGKHIYTGLPAELKKKKLSNAFPAKLPPEVKNPSLW